MNHNEIFVEDLDFIASSFKEDSEYFKEKTFLVTGATGLIGFTLVCSLLNFAKKNNFSLQVLALVRNEEKAQKIYSDYADDSMLKFVIGDVNNEICISDKIDYIIHAASETSSKAFVNSPVETIKTAILGTIHLLELAKQKSIKSFVYLSSMEVYGAPNNDEIITEDHATNLNTMSIRTSYPESKRMCESLCTAYAAEYHIPAKVIRLTQTFGPGVQYNDGRIFAEFARCVLENRDIILHTKGETKRNYLYTADAVTAIITVLLKGQNGEAYNAANRNTYCSILEMANLVANKIANNSIKVVVQEENSENFGYAPTLKMNLDTSKLSSLGWIPKTTLTEMFGHLVKTMA